MLNLLTRRADRSVVVYSYLRAISRDRDYALDTESSRIRLASLEGKCPGAIPVVYIGRVGCWTVHRAFGAIEA